MEEYGKHEQGLDGISELVLEFHADGLPLGSLNEEGVRNFFGLRVAGLDNSRDCNDLPFIRGIREGAGNYVATVIQANLRKSVSRIPNRSKNLAAILDLPLELILEIFGHLHPLDLYNMIRTSKYLRNLLLIRKASSLWETAFRRHPDLLPCPPDVSPPKWVSLLFAPASCDVCDRPKAMVDFTYRKRLCDNCLPKYWLQQADITNLGDLGSFNPNEVVSLWRLVRYTHRSRAMYFPGDYEYLFEPRYCSQDLLTRKQEMVPYLTAIEANQPNAREDYEAYQAKTRTKVLEYLLHVRACNNYCVTIWRNLQTQYREDLFSFCSMSWAHLIKLGHDPVDVEASRPDIAVHFSSYFEKANHARFSKREIYRHLPQLNEMAKRAKEERILKERRQLIDRREKKVAIFYESICRPLLEPDIWEYTPECRQVLNFGPISEYTHSSGDDIGDFSEEEMQATIINFVHTWILEKKRHLARILMYSHPAIEPRGDGALHSDGDVLELATAVFAHPLKSRSSREFCPGSIMIGWEEVGLHLPCAKDAKMGNPAGDDHDFYFSKVGYAAIVVLLRLLGLDPDIARASDMSTLNKRFICLNCPWMQENGILGTYVMNWKECASHAVVVKGATSNPIFCSIVGRTNSVDPIPRASIPSSWRPSMEL
ncbi:hypothetical protein GALMADRAFT_147582 [Galerina marginata CBS 339.88]|uniref:F-box domain-containing protein n=1 Tax=Galerina marginata (strain CBS 339.88) TaxID=685588 RepID=A0A067S7W7_GALM3|nr:hypothetical protein GALMADRAFT_147582 [Galerina marginata CBS 339.88]